MITGYKLERCPFCKATQAYLHIRRGHFAQVRCGKCGAEGPVALSDQEAVKKWNENRARKGKIWQQEMR